MPRCKHPVDLVITDVALGESGLKITGKGTERYVQAPGWLGVVCAANVDHGGRRDCVCDLLAGERFLPEGSSWRRIGINAGLFVRLCISGVMPGLVPGIHVLL